MNSVCINCGQPLPIKPTFGYASCNCLTKIFKDGCTLELRFRNGRRMEDEDLDEDAKGYLLVVWDFDRAQEMAERYREGYRRIGLEPPAVEVHIVDCDSGQSLRAIPLE